jgi:hypothetical protein
MGLRAGMENFFWDSWFAPYSVPYIPMPKGRGFTARFDNCDCRENQGYPFGVFGI